MNIEHVRTFCLSIHESVEEGCPFVNLGHPDVAFTIAGKIFAFLCVPDGPSCQHNSSDNLVVLKCNPDKAIELRDRYQGVIEPAWHWNKKYWNQVRYGMLPDDVVKMLILHSFDEVVAKMPKKLRAELKV